MTPPASPSNSRDRRHPNVQVEAEPLVDSHRRAGGSRATSASSAFTDTGIRTQTLKPGQVVGRVDLAEPVGRRAGMRATTKLFTILALAAALAPMAPASAAVTDAAIANFAFSPNPVNLTAGDTVKWTNSDSAAHTVT